MKSTRKQIFLQCGLLLLLLFVVPFVFLSLGQRADPIAIDSSNRYLEPASQAWFGTDGLGRSSFARTFYAAGLSLKMASQSLLVSFVLALILGGIAGLTRGRWPDRIISWVISVIYTIPFVLIAVALAAVIQPDIGSTYLLIGLLGWAAPARLFRASVMQLRSSQHVLAQRAYGFSETRIFLRSVLPLAIVPPFLGLIYFVPELVAIDVGLSFFGLGAQPPTPTLGRLIYDGFGEVRLAWWISVFPAALMIVFFIILYRVVDGLTMLVGKSGTSKH